MHFFNRIFILYEIVCDPCVFFWINGILSEYKINFLKSFSTVFSQLFTQLIIVIIICFQCKFTLIDINYINDHLRDSGSLIWII